MTNENNTRKKVNAIFFAAIMVVSMVAVGFAAAPAAATVTDITSASADDVDAEGASATQNVQFNTSIDGANSTEEYVIDVSAAEDAGIDVSISETTPGDITLSGPNATNVTVDSVTDNSDTDGEIVISIADDAADGAHDFTVAAALTHDTSSIDSSIEDVSYTLTADEQTETVTFDVDTQPDFDVNASNANVVFQGQVVLADGANVSPGESVTLRSGTPSDDNSFVRQNTANSRGEATFQTGNLEADDYYIENSSGDLVGNEFEITPQTFDGEFDPTEVDNAGENSDTTHEVDTNRGGTFNVLVSAEYDGDAVDNETLVDIINNADDDVVADDVDEDGAEEETVRVTGVSDGSDLVADFADIEDAGEYDITVEVEDTTAEASQTITVNDIGDGAVSLENGYVTVPQGDNAEITLEFDGGQDMGYVRVGDESEVGYEANITVDSNGEDNVTLLFNTYAAGSDRGDFVTIEDDDSDAEVTGDVQSPNDLDLLATGTYPIEVSDEDLDAIANDNANDVGDLEIQDREFNEELNVWTTSDNAFEDVEDADDVAAAAENGTLQQQSEVANGDVVVHEIQATGLEGLVETGVQNDSDAVYSDEDGFLGTLSTNDTEGLDLRIRQTSDTTSPNSPRKVANFTDLDGDISVIEGDGVYYLAFDTDNLALDNGDLENGDAFDVRLRLKDERLLDPDEDELEDGEISDFYQTATTTFSVEEPEGAFDEPVEVEAGEGQVISGTSNVAAGNTLSIRARSDDEVTPGFVVSQSEVEIDTDGTFTADELDFSDASVGDNFTVTTSSSPFEESLEVDGTVVETIDDGTDDGDDGNVTDGEDGDDGNVTDGEDGDDGNVTDGEDGTDTDGEDGNDTDGEDGNDSDGSDGSDGGDSEDGTPGFGAIVALVALIAAALLATRRNE